MKPTNITIHWVYNVTYENGIVDGGILEGVADNDLDAAIGLAMHQLNFDIPVDHFAREPHIDGGFAVWTR